MKTQQRFEVHDDEGPLRTFSRKEEAKAFMCGRNDMKLVVRPRLQKEKDGASIGLVDAPALY